MIFTIGKIAADDILYKSLCQINLSVRGYQIMTDWLLVPLSNACDVSGGLIT